MIAWSRKLPPGGGGRPPPRPAPPARGGGGGGGGRAATTHPPAPPQRVKIARLRRGHLGRHPAAKAEPDEAGALDPQFGEQPLIERGDVARVAHPLRALGHPET